MIWLNHFLSSPQRDNGYDISDYTAVDLSLEDMADLKDGQGRPAACIDFMRTWF